MADNGPTPNAAPPSGATTIDLAAYQAQLRAAFVQALTEDDLRTIARKLIEQAREGDQTSARLVLKYSLGVAVRAGDRRSAARPTPRVDAATAAFAANAAKVLRELDAAEREELRQAAAASPRPGGPPPGNHRR